jgi:polysaccharide pyruvyl transferase CsaB
MSQSARILVSGYYGLGNAGDEAILAGLVAGLRESGADVETTVLSGDPASTQREHGVAAVRRSILQASRRARGSNLLISGGGGLLQDVTSWRSPLYYLGVIVAARASGVPVAAVGQGVGPLRRGAIQAAARRILNGVDVIAVRDAASRRALHSIGVEREVEVTADLAFLLPKPTQAEVEAVWGAARVREGERRAAVAVRSVPGAAGHDETAAELAAAIGEGCSRCGLTPVLVPMQRDRDLQLAEAVARAMPCAAQVVAGGRSVRQLLALVAGCDLVIAARLHALIFAAICGVPPVALSYDPKVDALMDQLSLPVATALSPLDATGLIEAVQETWRTRSTIHDLLVDRTRGLRAAAMRNVELALSLL